MTSDSRLMKSNPAIAVGDPKSKSRNVAAPCPCHAYSLPDPSRPALLLAAFWSAQLALNGTLLVYIVDGAVRRNPSGVPRKRICRAPRFCDVPVEVSTSHRRYCAGTRATERRTPAPFEPVGENVTDGSEASNVGSW